MLRNPSGIGGSQHDICRPCLFGNLWPPSQHIARFRCDDLVWFRGFFGQTGTIHEITPNRTNKSASCNSWIVLLVEGVWFALRAQCGRDVRAPSTMSPHSSSMTHNYAAVATALGWMTVSAKRSISSSWGLHWSSSRSTPAASNSAMRLATCSGVPTRPERKPRLDTE